MRDSQGFHLDQPGDKDVRLFTQDGLFLAAKCFWGKVRRWVWVCGCVWVWVGGCVGVCV